MSNSNVVRTGVAAVIQTCQYLGKAIEVIPNSTLNQKLSIQNDVTIASTEVPSVKYVAIGNGGHGFITGANNRVKWQALQHTVKNTALYNQLPFVLRLPTEDLSATERLKYRLRRLEPHNGTQYVAYYLRVLDLTEVEVSLQLRHVENGVTTSTLYVPTIEDLNPTPPSLTTGELVTTTGDYIASTATVPFVMTADDTTEFINAVKIIEGEDGYAVISEMATVSGVDRSVTGNFNGVSQSYTEVIYAQITSFITTAWVMEYQTDGVTLTIDIGNVEPLLTVAS